MSGDAAPCSESPFLAALGADARRLRPEVRRYAAGPGCGVGVGEGVFSVAGSRFGRWNLLARPLLGPRLLVTRCEREVPFRVENRAGRSPEGGSELRADRRFSFRGGAERFVDVLRQGDAPGTLTNLLGSAERIELRLRCEATERGNLRLRSERAWFRFGPIRLPLPGLLSVRVEVEDGYDEMVGRRTIDARVRSPFLGTVLEYRGSFVYRVEALGS